VTDTSRRCDIPGFARCGGFLSSWPVYLAQSGGLATRPLGCRALSWDSVSGK